MKGWETDKGSAAVGELWGGDGEGEGALDGIIQHV